MLILIISKNMIKTLLFFLSESLQCQIASIYLFLWYNKGRHQLSYFLLLKCLVWFMVCKATFDSMSVIQWQFCCWLSTRRRPPTCRKPLTNFITYCCIEYTSVWTGLELTTLVIYWLHSPTTKRSKPRQHCSKWYPW